MTQDAFKRGLSPEFVDALNEKYEDTGGWWRNLVDDKDTFVAIRDNYLNVYYRGNSLLKLDWNQRDKSMTGQVHYKYLLRPNIRESEYVKVDEKGEVTMPDEPMFSTKIGAVPALKKASQVYAGDEKDGVHRIALNKKHNVVDVEVAFRVSGLRVDLAALQETGDIPKLVFYEAKHFSNKELRAKGDRNPSVIDQLDRYSVLLEKNKKPLEESYRKVCKNLKDLNGLKQRHHGRHEVLDRVVQRGLDVDPTPRLVVFGFDQDQRDGKVWEEHRRKLEREKGSTGCWGNPASVRLVGW